MKLSPEARRRLAGEYVLGTLRGRARRWFDRHLGTDAAGRADVAWWQERLHGLYGARAARPQPPPAAVWDRIARLTAETADTVSPDTARAQAQAVALLGGPASAVPANEPRFVPVSRLRAWQLATGLGIAASAALAGVLALRPPDVVTHTRIINRTRVVRAPAPVPTPASAPEAARPWLAMLNAPAPRRGGGKAAGDTPRWVVILSETDAAQPTAPGRLRIRADGPGYQLPPGRALELWVIGPAGPESLGVIPTTGTATLDLPPGRRLPAEPTLAVSVEPAGGSPSGSPTGPVILTAPAVQAF